MSSSTASTDGATMPRWQRALANSVFLYPLLMHFLIVNDLLALALSGLAAMSLIAAALSLQPPHAGVQAALYFLIALASLVGLGGGAQFALYLPPVVFNLMFASVFLQTLRRGAVPMIERFMRFHHGDALPPVGVVYARQLTLIWIGLLVTAALTSVVLAVFAPLETWSLFANVVNYALIAALFIGQFVYGYARHRILRPKQIVPTVMRMAHRAAKRGSFGR